MAQTMAEEMTEADHMWTAPLGRPAGTGTSPSRARRVVLKLSGEVFGGGAVGVDPDVVQGIARQIATVTRDGVQVAEPYIPLRAIRHLEKGRVVIFGAGAGMPYFSTDTVTAQRALEIHADIVLMSKNGVDGVYTADPRTDPTARKLDTVTFAEMIKQGLRVADPAAYSLCEENNLPMLVFGAEGDDTIVRALSGEKIGTLITP